MLTAEQIESNYNLFYKLCSKLGDRSEVAQKMVDDLGERLALCPASTKLDYHNAFPGGLVDHSLRVYQNARTLSDNLKFDFSKESLILSSLFHDIGKVGDETSDYYVEQDSEWHRSKLGEMYKYNKDLVYMTVPHRSVWLCQHYGVKLSKEEFLAISLNDGQYIEENKPYKMKEPDLAMIVHMADLISVKFEKSNN